MNSIMFAWVGYQRRAESMREYWGYDLIHYGNRFSSRYLRFIDYLAKLSKMLWVLVSRRPDVLWVQLPPGFLCHIAMLYRFISRIFLRRVIIIGDIHNSMLRPIWLNLPGAKFCMLRFDILLVHNKYVLEDLKKAGFSDENLYVLEDLPPSLASKVSLRPKRDNVVFPCSFDVDEPIDVVLAAAKMLPEVDFYITGNFLKIKDKDLIKDASANVKFTGFISKPEFESLLNNATVILGLTTRESVQLSVANEGVGALKPIVLSDTKTLRSLFSEAAVFVETMSSDSMAGGILHAINNYDALSEKSLVLKGLRDVAWRKSADKIRDLIV